MHTLQNVHTLVRDVHGTEQKGVSSSHFYY